MAIHLAHTIFYACFKSNKSKSSQNKCELLRNLSDNSTIEMTINSVCSFQRFRINTLLCVGIIALGIIHLEHVECDGGPGKMWARYKPLAMDENVWVRVSPNPDEYHNDQKQPSPSHPVISSGSNKTVTESLIDGIREVNRNKLPSSHPSKGEYMEVDDWKGENVKDTLFRLPNFESSKLTKLITRENPTFVSNQVIEPTITAKGNTTKGYNKILASYKFLVPIFVPAIKRKVSTTNRPPVRFVKEQFTEMIPVKKVVPVVKEVIKAEEVPQQVITQFVTTPGDKVPANVDTQVKPGESLVTW